VTMGALVTVSLPCAAVEALMSLDSGRLSGQVRRAVETVLSSGRPCPPAPVPTGCRVRTQVYVREPLYGRLVELVEGGVYNSLAEAVRSVVLCFLGMPPTAAPAGEPRRRSYEHRLPVLAAPMCGSASLGVGEELVRVVKCALRRLVEGARGRVVAVGAKRVCKALGLASTCVPPVYMAALFDMVREVVGDCALYEYRRVDGITLVADVACLRGRL